MLRNQEEPKQDHFLVTFTCTVTCEGWIVVDGTRDTAARNARNMDLVFGTCSAVAISDAPCSKNIAIGKIDKEGTVRAARIR